MSKTIIDDIMEAKKNHEIAQIGFYNDGKVRTEEYWFAKRMEDTNSEYSYEVIQDVLADCAKTYIYSCDFDSVTLNLAIGLMYNKEDVNAKNKINPDAEPIRDYVRYYTKDANCYLNGKKTNKYNAGEYKSRQGYIKYDELVKLANKNGLIFNGPENFDEFEESILCGVPFDITLGARLVEKEDTKHNQNVRVK
ncbi:MAG: hypothetical protein IKQ06_04515 [Bacilli bacterium]|nr:hypothetical protein [Bacilli bacterium]